MGNIYYIPPMEKKEATGVLDPCFHTPLIRVVIGRSVETTQIRMINQECKRAMIDTGSFLCWLKLADIEAYKLEKTNQKISTFSVKLNQVIETEVFTGCLFLDGNGIIVNVRFGVLGDDFEFDAIIGTELLQEFKFTYDPTTRTCFLNHIGK